MPDFLAEALELFEYTRALRRDFHMHPELALQEVRTAGMVGRELNALGMEVHSGIAKTGVVGLLEGEHPGQVVFRDADPGIRHRHNKAAAVDSSGDDDASAGWGELDGVVNEVDQDLLQPGFVSRNAR